MAEKHPLTQVPVLKTAPPHQGGRYSGNGAQAGDRKPGTPEGEGDEGMIPGWEMIKSLFLGNTNNVFKNLSRLAMMWTVYHQWSGGRRFALNCYRHSAKPPFHHLEEVEPETLLSKEGVT